MVTAGEKGVKLIVPPVGPLTSKVAVTALLHCSSEI
jgi:hypothetical protein